MKAKKKKMYSYPGGGKLELMYKKGGMLGKRKVLDANKDGKLTAEDFALLRLMFKKRKRK